MDAYLSIGQHDDTYLYHGLVYRNHPTPSGMDRWLLAVSTTRGFETEHAAGVFMNEQYPDLTPLDVAKLSTYNMFKDLPALPKGTEVTVMTYNPKSIDPAPSEELPCIQLRYQNKPLYRSLTNDQMHMLVKRGALVFDSGSGQDPELSCEYHHYYVPHHNDGSTNNVVAMSSVS